MGEAHAPLAEALHDVPRDGDGRVDLLRVAAALAPPGAGGATLLESAPRTSGTGRWSYVVAGSVGRLVDPADPFGALAERCAQLGLDPHAPRDPSLPPLTGGLVGTWSYDLARHAERLPEHAARDRDVPVLDLVEADMLVAVDHDAETALLVHRPLRGRRPTAELRAVADRLADASPLPEPARPAHRVATTSLPRDRYLAAVAAILEHIAAGDTFQINLSQRLTTTWPGDGWELYRALRSQSPAPYGAVAPAGRSTVVSISPETFLDVDAGRVTTRPIKGTRPRGRDPREDDRLRDELLASAKDRAENVMVVDMERNDLGRVCVPGSVETPSLLAPEAHPTVWHLVSTVTGRLRPSVRYADLLRATFPSGSVTGTPKVRAMELIDRYEPVRRGAYCGAVGFLSVGAASLSVAIRTATLHPDGILDYGAGGGIVADSDPAAEHAETLAKAAAFLRAVQADPPEAP